MVIKYRPWTNMRLMLNKVASENIKDLFPTDWHPRPTMSDVQMKQYKVLTEMMTEKFQQCGYLPEESTIELDNYQDFWKVLQHHTFVGNISTTQLTHFIMMMVYISFYRLGHYTKYMTNREAVFLRAAVQMSLVIIFFKTTFSTNGSHNFINPYFKVIPTVVRNIIG